MPGRRAALERRRGAVERRAGALERRLVDDRVDVVVRGRVAVFVGTPAA
ncbi:MAG TPA: hypothetical protein VMH41_06530 [Mycobacteriales bacterium]|nr:hypothetical protein [Mycobacteriales bacterium]